MNKNKIIVTVLFASVLLVACINKQKSHLFGDVPDVVRALIRDQIELSESVDVSRATADRDVVLYYRMRNIDLAEKYYEKFKAAVVKLEGNKVLTEVHGDLPFEIIEQARIADMSGDTLAGVNDFKVRFVMKIRTTKTIKPTYFDERKGWMITGYIMSVLKSGNHSGMSTFPLCFELGDSAMIESSVPTIPVGREAVVEYSYHFTNGNTQNALDNIDKIEQLHKFIFLQEWDFWSAVRVNDYCRKDLPTSEDLAKKRMVKATDVPKAYDIPYVLTTHPKNGAVVDTSLREVRITFNMPMATQLKMIEGVREEGVNYIIRPQGHTREEWKDVFYWEDDFTFVYKITNKLESGKTYGVCMPAGMQSKEDNTKTVDADLNVVFSVE